MVPSLLLAPTPLLLRQWRHMYDRGKVVGPPTSLVAAFSYGYLAYKQYNTPLSTNHPRGELYAIAALLTVCVAPYTLLFMLGTNGKLQDACEEMQGFAVGEEVEAKGKRESARQLLDWWGVLNAGRASMSLVAAVLGSWASLA